MIKILKICCALVCCVVFTAEASGIDKNTAKMQAMDKITGRVSVIYVPVGGMVEFGSLSIVVRACKTRPMEETPDNFVFADIADKTLKGEDVNIFRGWMISSSPATHAVEHPIYDVWLLSCEDRKVDKKLLLSAEQLAAHENIPSLAMPKTVHKETLVEAAENGEPISEMQEDTSHRQENVETGMEFSYDEADMEEEGTEEGESEGAVEGETAENENAVAE